MTSSNCTDAGGRRQIQGHRISARGRDGPGRCRLLQRGHPAGGGSERARPVDRHEQGLETAQALREQPPPSGRSLKGLTARDRMERTLLTKRRAVASTRDAARP